MKEKIIVGADISKQTIDLHLKPSETHFCIENNVSGFKKMLKELNLIPGSEILIVMEHTGSYSRRFENYLQLMELITVKLQHWKLNDL